MSKEAERMAYESGCIGGADVSGGIVPDNWASPDEIIEESDDSDKEVTNQD